MLTSLYLCMFILIGAVTYDIHGFLAKNKDKLTDTLEMLVCTMKISRMKVANRSL